MGETTTHSKDYLALIADLKSRVRAARIKAAVSINQELVALYWDLGRLISERIDEAQWGDNVIARIATDLRREFPSMKGFSRRNLYRMRQWYLFYARNERIVPQAVAQIPWGHNDLIVSKIADVEQALWYAHATAEHGWSRNLLQHHIETDLYARQATNAKIENFGSRLPSPGSDLARETLKDPYIFDFLHLEKDAGERELSRGLVEHLQKFMLELGKGFAFVGREVPLEVGGEDFFIDLLFYHLKLHCYVVMELKSGPFRAAYAGKLNFYLTAVDKLMKTSDDNPSIGIVLCKDRNRIIAEYALEGLTKPMGVATYALSHEVPPELAEALPSVADLAAELTDDETDG